MFPPQGLELALPFAWEVLPRDVRTACPSFPAGIYPDVTLQRAFPALLLIFPLHLSPGEVL